MHRRTLRSLSLLSVVLATPLRAQATDDALREAMLADLAGGPALVSNLLPVLGACPVCGAPMRELKLRDHEGRRIDGPSGESARVCEQDALWLWYPHQQMRDGTYVPDGRAAGPVALRLGKCDRTLGPLPWDAVSMAVAPSPAPTGASVDAVTLDGRLAVGNLHDGSVRVWARDAKELLLDQKDWGVTGVELSPRGDALAFARNQGPVQVFALPSGKQLLSAKAPSEWVGRLAFDPDLRFLAMGCQRGPGPDAFAVELLDLRSKKRTSVTPFGTVCTTALVFSGDGALLAIGDRDGGVRVWNTATQKAVFETSFRLGIGALEFSPDGQRLAVAVGYGFEVHVLASADGAAVARIQVPGEPERCAIPNARLAFSADGSLLAFGGGTLHWCKLDRPDEPRRFFAIGEHDKPWFDGQALVTVGQERRIVWELGRAQPAR